MGFFVKLPPDPTGGGGGGDVPSTRTLTAGAGLTGGGDLSANRTFAVDFTAVVAPTRTLTAGSGLTGGGDLSANRSFAVDFTAVAPTSRNLTAGTGLTGGGTLAADRSFAVDFGSGAGKVLQAQKTSVETVLALATTGVVKSTTGVLSSGLLADGDVDNAAAISGLKINPNFGSQNISTTGAIAFGGTPSTTGNIRHPGGNVTQIAYRTNANSADISAMSSDTSNNLIINGSGSALAGQLLLGSTSNATHIGLSSTSGLYFASTLASAAVGISHLTRGNNTACVDFPISAQSANAGATGTNKNAAFLLLSGGARTDTAGKRGGVRLQLNKSNTEVMLEACDVQAEGTSLSRVLSLVHLNGISTTDHPAGAGSLVINVGECEGGHPIASPGNNSVVLYNVGGDFFKRTVNGHQQALGNRRVTRAWPSDANYTAVVADYSATSIELTGGALTATRNFVVPLVSGYRWAIFNNTTGAQSIQVIGATGTGITIATGKRAIVECDGTNIVRLTADI